MLPPVQKRAQSEYLTPQPSVMSLSDSSLLAAVDQQHTGEWVKQQQQLQGGEMLVDLVYIISGMQCSPLWTNKGVGLL